MWEVVECRYFLWSAHCVYFIIEAFWPELWLFKTLGALTGLCWLFNSGLHIYKGQTDLHCGAQWVTSDPWTCGCNYYFVNIFIEFRSTKLCSFFFFFFWPRVIALGMTVSSPKYVCNIKKNEKMTTLKNLNVNSLRHPPIYLWKSYQHFSTKFSAPPQLSA